MEDNSGVKFHEAQVALARQWVSGDTKTSQKTVTINITQETKEAMVVTDKTPPKTETVPIPESDEAASQLIARFVCGAQGVRGDEAVADNVAQHMLTDSTSLLDEQWLGTPEEELNAYGAVVLYQPSTSDALL